MNIPKGDEIMRSAARITSARRDIEKGPPHNCEARHCLPIMSEHTLITLGLLPSREPVICPSVYVCRLGQIHVCTDETCTFYINTHTGTCPLTGAYHGHTRGDTGYIPVEKRTGGFKRGKNAKVPVYALGEGKRGRHDEEVKEEEDISFVIAKKARSNAFGSALFATSANAKIISPALPPPPSQFQLPPPPKEEKKDDDNAEIESVDYSKRLLLSSSRKRTRDNDDDDIVERVVLSENKIARLSNMAENIVIQLFYSNERRIINDNKRFILDTERNQAVKNYYNERRNSIPIWVEVLNIMAGFDTQIPHLVILKRNNQRIARYVSIGLHTWTTVINSPWGRENPGIRFDAHMMSVLYRMRQGLVIHGIEILPLDKYACYLPLRIDLPLYGDRFESSIVTNGIKNLKRAYESLIEEGATANQLRLPLF